MRNFFNLDNPVFQLLTRLADLVITSMLCLICCVPVVTAGAAFAALAKTTQGLVRDEVTGTARTFFRAFRANFKQATAVWLCAVVVIAAIVCDYLLLRYFVTGALYTVLFVVLVVLAFIVLAILAYVFPLIARYENTVKEHVRNAMVLSIYKLPKTILMVFLHVLPLLLAYFFPTILVYTMPFWVFMGFGFCSHVDSALLVPVFAELEKH